MSPNLWYFIRQLRLTETVGDLKEQASEPKGKEHEEEAASSDDECHREVIKDEKWKRLGSF